MCDDIRKGALRDWKVRVHTWYAQSKDLYRYLKNETPAKCTGVQTEDTTTTVDPIQMEACLERFWGSLESWPDPTSLWNATDMIEDVYSLFLPHVPFAAGVTGAEVVKQLMKRKVSAAGPDGWTRKELRPLPEQAFSQVIGILTSMDAWARSMLAIFKRVPILKNPCLPPSPDNFRPIDVFSHLLRALTSAQVASLRPWLVKVLHRSQYASDRGAVAAVADLSVEAESVLHGTREVWAFTADFSKPYNTLSIHVRLKIAELMGLSLSAVPLLYSPLMCAKGCWRMPHDCAAPFRQHERVLPQGMATSVILAEICVAAFLWRMHTIVTLNSLCYVDDLNEKRC